MDPLGSRVRMCGTSCVTATITASSARVIAFGVWHASLSVFSCIQRSRGLVGQPDEVSRPVHGSVAANAGFGISRKNRPAAGSAIYIEQMRQGRDGGAVLVFLRGAKQGPRRGMQQTGVQMVGKVIQGL